MNIIAGTYTDLIAPFPAVETPRIFGWNHCYRSLSEDDSIPQERDAFIAYMQELLPQCVTAGVIDKGQLTSAKHEAPMVGVVAFVPQSLRDGAVHFASGRKAFKMGLMEEAMEVFIQYLFATYDSLTRVSAAVDESNSPVKGLLRRLGFRFEGVQRAAVMKDGAMRDLVLFGRVRAQAELVVPVEEEVNGNA